MVVRSHKEDDWNAIAPNLFIEDDCHLRLVWGSFWSGLKMRRIDPTTGKLSSEDTRLYALASRPRTLEIKGSVAYDGVTGRSSLQISTMVWEDGWPRVGVLP